MICPDCQDGDSICLRCEGTGYVCDECGESAPRGTHACAGPCPCQVRPPVSRLALLILAVEALPERQFPVQGSQFPAPGFQNQTDPTDPTDAEPGTLPTDKPINR